MKIKTDYTYLVWTDNEMQIFLETTRYFKVGKAYKSVDWENMRDKYKKIRENCVSNHLQ